MGKYQRDKGHNFERATAALLRDVWPEAKRGQQSRFGGDAPDVDGTPYWIECKVGKRPNIRAAMAQAQEATDGRTCIVVSHKDRERTMVTMGFETFLELVGASE